MKMTMSSGRLLFSPYMFHYNIIKVPLSLWDQYTHVTCADIVCKYVCVCVQVPVTVCVTIVTLHLPCRSRCSPLVSLDVHLIPVSYWQLRSGMPADNRDTSRHACVTVCWAFSDMSHAPISTDMILKLLTESKYCAAQQHWRPDGRVSPSLDCPTETLSAVASHKVKLPPYDRSTYWY